MHYAGQGQYLEEHNALPHAQQKIMSAICDGMDQQLFQNNFASSFKGPSAYCLTQLDNGRHGHAMTEILHD